MATRPDMTCRVCAESPHGAWPKWHRGTHCRDCHASWTGIQAAHCTLCHRTFTSNAAADRHARRGYRDDSGELRRRCTDPATIDSFRLIERGGNYYWTPASGVIRREISDETGVGGAGVPTAIAVAIIARLERKARDGTATDSDLIELNRWRNIRDSYRTNQDDHVILHADTPNPARRTRRAQQ